MTVGRVHPPSAGLGSGSLRGQVVVMSGGSRGIGLATAVAAARSGAAVAILAKTTRPDPRIPGTIHSAAAAIEAAGGQALPLECDIRSDSAVRTAIDTVMTRWGRIDCVVNNASAIALQPVGTLPMKRFDLMMDINVRGTFLLTSEALPHLLASEAPRVVSLSPPIQLERRWLRDHAPYTVSKYGMTMLTLGLHENLHDSGLRATCLWPRTLIATAAVMNVVGGPEAAARARRPEIMADAAYAILLCPDSRWAGRCVLDEDVLRETGVSDFSAYLAEGAREDQLEPDLFVETPT